MNNKQNTESTLNLVEEAVDEDQSREVNSSLEIQNTMMLPVEELDYHHAKDFMKVDKTPKTPMRINSGSLSIFTYSQIVVALGIWFVSIVGLCRADDLKAVHIASLLSSAVFFFAGYIGVRTIRKPMKFRIFLYIGLCIASFIYGIVMVAVNIKILVTKNQERELLIAEATLDFVQIVLAATSVALIRKLLKVIFPADYPSSLI